ncbi:transposase [Flavimaricola marinus]|uniref:Transposase n=1 Tax=Flavimaricola marinus TaxID=1819565 RepID=A0A238LL19_9RHOB|nr:transposase [Flavimaricola marinus]SMY10407.1 Transposase [Flavimaricola marinus]
MKRSRFSKERINAILKRQESFAATANACREHWGSNSATFYKWKAKFRGLEESDARNLKKLLAEALIANPMLRDVVSRKW